MRVLLRQLLLCPLLMVNVLYGTLDLYTEVGYHMEQLTLNFNGEEPTLRESFDRLKWEQVRTPEIRLGANYKFSEWFKIEADGGVLIENGSSTTFNATFCEERGVRPFIGRSTHGKVSGADFSVAFGGEAKATDWLTLTPLFGYGQIYRLYSEHPGVLHIAKGYEGDGERFDIVNLRYRANFRGPWLGLRSNVMICPNWQLITSIQYHRTKLCTSARWKVEELLSDNYSFYSQSRATQKGTASGFKVDAVIKRCLTAHVNLYLHGYYEKLVRNSGHDLTRTEQQVYSPNGALAAQESFNHKSRYSVHWYQWAVLGGVDYVF